MYTIFMVNRCMTNFYFLLGRLDGCGFLGILLFPKCSHQVLTVFPSTWILNIFFKFNCVLNSNSLCLKIFAQVALMELTIIGNYMFLCLQAKLLFQESPRSRTFCDRTIKEAHSDKIF